GCGSERSRRSDMIEAIEREAMRAERFVRHGEQAREHALAYGDGKFFATLAYQSAFLSQVRCLQTGFTDQAVLSLRCALKDFLFALELGYSTEAVEITNWFYRSLVVNDQDAAHFLASLPTRVWPYGDDFARKQAAWGFALLRGERDRASDILEFLYGLCFETQEPPIEGRLPARQIQENSYKLMLAISEENSSSTTACLRERIKLRPMVPLEGTRYELFQPLDLIGLGYCRLARMCGITVNVEDPSLPLG